MAGGRRRPSAYNESVTSLRLAIALLLVLCAQPVMAQSSPMVGMLEQEAWAALDAGRAQVAE